MWSFMTDIIDLSIFTPQSPIDLMRDYIKIYSKEISQQYEEESGDSDGDSNINMFTALTSQTLQTVPSSPDENYLNESKSFTCIKSPEPMIFSRVSTPMSNSYQATDGRSNSPDFSYGSTTALEIETNNIKTNEMTSIKIPLKEKFILSEPLVNYVEFILEGKYKNNLFHPTKKFISEEDNYSNQYYSSNGMRIKEHQDDPLRSPIYSPNPTSMTFRASSKEESKNQMRHSSGDQIKKNYSNSFMGEIYPITNETDECSPMTKKWNELGFARSIEICTNEKYMQDKYNNTSMKNKNKSSGKLNENVTNMEPCTNSIGNMIHEKKKHKNNTTLKESDEEGMMYEIVLEEGKKDECEIGKNKMFQSNHSVRGEKGQGRQCQGNLMYISPTKPNDHTNPIVVEGGGTYEENYPLLNDQMMTMSFSSLFDFTDDSIFY